MGKQGIPDASVCPVTVQVLVDRRHTAHNHSGITSQTNSTHTNTETCKANDAHTNEAQMSHLVAAPRSSFLATYSTAPPVDLKKPSNHTNNFFPNSR